ncbi:hypothetical protein M885DRAFT_535179 [Pelagophyceae sp. CCMP2097]|nr:hypothetical protein M885DRAFT_535179 [Pelagophyceae sp. CCMP2097]
MEGVMGAFSAAVRAEDGAAVAAQLRILGAPLSQACYQACSGGDESRVERTAVQRCGERWGPILAKQLLARAAMADDDAARCYKHAVAAYNLLINAMRDEAGWVVPVVRLLTYEARVVAEKADAQRYSTHKRARVGAAAAASAAAAVATSRHDTLRDVEKTLKKGFSACWNDRSSSEQSKKRATIYVVAQLLKIYFKLNLVKLAQPLIRPLEATAGKAGHFDRRGVFPLGDIVAYRFFIGRLRMFEDHYAEAEEHLAYAFDHCDRRCVKNKRAILEFLLPVRLRRGVLPKRELLAKYGLEHLSPLIAAVKAGDLRTFNSELAANQQVFVRRGTYLLLEKVKLLVYRNLFKKIYLVQQKAAQLKLQLFQKALAWLGMAIDLDEIECILANLIFKGLVKGYISHQKQTLVLSKKAPFPTETLKDF